MVGNVFAAVEVVVVVLVEPHFVVIEEKKVIEEPPKVEKHLQHIQDSDDMGTEQQEPCL